MKLSPLVKKVLIWAITVALVYGGYAYFFKKSTTNTAFTAVTTTVKKGNIENSVQVIGVSALVYEQKMQFSQGGKVAKIYFNEGDKVKKWQVMAELDTTDVLNDIKQWWVSLSNAQIKLQQLINGPTAKDILSAENTVTSAQSKITTLQNDRANILRDKANKQTDYQGQIVTQEDTIKSKQAQLVNAQNELATLQKTQTKNLTDVGTDIAKTLDTAIIDARKQIIDADASLYNADEILGISDANRLKNDSYEVYLSAKDISLRTKAESDWGQATSLLADAKKILTTMPQATSNSTDTKNLLLSLSKAEDMLINLGKDGTDAVNASITSSSFPQTTIDTYANVFSSITSSSQSSLSAINNTLANINTLSDPTLQQASNTDSINKQNQAISDQENAIKQSERDLAKIQSDMLYSASTYDAQITSNDLDTANANDALKYAQESLRLLKAGATKEDIALAKNSIASQQLALQKVKEGITKYQLEAPFDGVLRKVDFKLGDNIVTNSSATPEYLYIENPNLVEITASVDQLDVVKLKLGQDAKIVFDSFPTLTLTGQVSDINSTPTVTSGVTSYSIKVTMDKGDHPIFSGMSAKVDIIIESKSDTLVVPTSFVTKGRGQPSVLKRVGTVDTKTDVTLGISNPSNTEILEGVNEWDTIARRIATGTGTAAAAGLQIPGVGGGNRGAWGGGGGAGGGGGGGGGNFNRGG